MITWPCYVIWLPKFPYCLYLNPFIQLSAWMYRNLFPFWGSHNNWVLFVTLKDLAAESTWLKSHNRRTWYHFLDTIYLELCLLFYSHIILTLDQWLLWLLVIFIHSWALGLSGLGSQLGTAGGSAIPNPDIISKIWPCNWIVFSRLLVLFHFINLVLGVHCNLYT